MYSALPILISPLGIFTHTISIGMGSLLKPIPERARTIDERPSVPTTKSLNILFAELG